MPLTVIQHRARQVSELAGHYVYCGRPSKWGNPFKMRERSGTERAHVIQAFRKYWYAPEQAQLREDALKELPRDGELGCFCAPLPCHCDVIAEYVNAQRAETPQAPSS